MKREVMELSIRNNKRLGYISYVLFLAALTLIIGIVHSVSAEETTRPTDGHIFYVDASVPSGGNGSMDSPFSEIRDAIIAAEDGDTLRVWEGEYYWIRLNINKTLRIIGNGTEKPVVKGFKISKDNVLIENLSFTRGILIYQGSNNLTIRNCSIEGASIGIDVSWVRNISIIDCSIKNCSSSGISGGFLESNIINCLFENCEDGIWVGGDEVIIENCMFRNNSQGIVISSYRRRFTVVNCSFERNELAIRCPEDTILKDNQFIDNDQNITVSKEHDIGAMNAMNAIDWNIVFGGIIVGVIILPFLMTLDHWLLKRK